MSIDPSTDKFRKVKAYTATTLQTSINNTDTSLTPASVTGWPTDAPVTIVIDRVDTNGNPTPTKREVITGAVSGTDLINCVRAQDSTTAQAHSAGAVIEILSTATDWNELIEGILAQHNQDGSHKADSVDTQAIQDDAVTQDKIGDEAVGTDQIEDGKVTNAKIASEAWTTYTPSWSGAGSNPAIGNGSITGRYQQRGKTVHFRLVIAAGSTTSFGSGTYFFQLPVTPSATAVDQIVMATAVDGATRYLGVVRFDGSLYVSPSDAVTRNLWSPSVPFTFASGDRMIIQGTYEAA